MNKFRNGNKRESFFSTNKIQKKVIYIKIKEKEDDDWPEQPDLC